MTIIWNLHIAYSKTKLSGCLRADFAIENALRSKGYHLGKSCRKINLYSLRSLIINGDNFAMLCKF